MLLNVKGLRVAYQGTEVVHGVDFSVEEGKITVLVGANGAGKTSILKAIMGLVKAKAGEVKFESTDLFSLPPYRRISLGISLCPEGRQLFPDMSVAENLEMGAYTIKDKAKVKEQLQSVYDQFPRLAERKDQKAGTLSGGEQEMLAIARALMVKPRLLILDEPSWGLAPMMVEEVMNIIQKINQQGTTILLVEQNANSALKICDYGYVLDVGEVVIHGTGEALLKDQKVKEIYIGA